MADTGIPDDVVERALSAYAGKDWPDGYTPGQLDEIKHDMRAAGHVFVEWALAQPRGTYKAAQRRWRKRRR